MIVLNVGGMHLHGKQRALGVGDDMTLASLDPLGHVKPAWTATFRGFHALAVDNPSRWSRFASLPFTHSPHQRIVDRAPKAGTTPLVEVILNRRTRRKVLRQRSPLAAARCNVEDRVQDRAQTDLRRPTTPTSPRHQRSDQIPLCI